MDKEKIRKVLRDGKEIEVDKVKTLNWEKIEGPKAKPIEINKGNLLTVLIAEKMI